MTSHPARTLARKWREEYGDSALEKAQEQAEYCREHGQIDALILWNQVIERLKQSP